MPALNDDVATKVSVGASQQFVNEYYGALNRSRDKIQSFYVSPSAMPDGKALPTIVYNGNIIPDPAAMQSFFIHQMPEARYEVQDYDCHPLNPEYIVDPARATQTKSGKNMTILVIVSGFVKYGEIRSVDPNGFSETFVLVPAHTTTPAANRSPPREWLVQSQTFRLVS